MCTMAAGDLTTTALLMAVLGVLIAISVLLGRTVDKLGVPVVLLFLVLGIIGGSEGVGGIAFDNYSMAMRLGTLALVLILFDGGLNTSLGDVRRTLGPAGILATVGVMLTACIVAIAARLFGLSWPEAMLLGAVVSSTDAAAVFAVLRGSRLNLQPRVGRTLEVESCINDPMAVILTMALIDMMIAPQAGGAWLKLIWMVPLQLAVGLVIGYGLGRLAATLMQKITLSTAGLYPALTVAVGLISYGLASLLWGSGFLAVFTTALVLGNGPLPYRSGLTRIHDALAWMGQITMFLMLGLLVFPSHLVQVATAGLGIGLVLAVIARPAAVALCLLPFGFPVRQTAYIGWVGLRGAVPIILATFPLLAGVEGAERIFNLVFFIVLVSSFVPGATIRPFTRRMGLLVPQRPVPEAVLEINASHTLNGTLESFHISPALIVCNAPLSEIDMPHDASISLIVRGKDIVPARGKTRLQPGDHVYVFFQPKDRPFIELLFGGPEA